MRRFSTRDLLWLTLVVGISLGWWLDHSRQASHLKTATGRLTRWYTAAGTLQDMLSDNDWKVTWNLEKGWIECERPTQTRGSVILSVHQPAVPVDALDGMTNDFLGGP